MSLARLLVTHPDIILLDEPTNHLDIESIQWLETFLMNYKGAVVIVAHDRYFLDRIVTKVVEISMHKSAVYDGNYTEYAKKAAFAREEALRAYYNQQREIKHQEAVIEKLKSFNREKSIKRAESREKQLAKIDVLEKPQEEKSEMHMTLTLLLLAETMYCGWKVCPKLMIKRNCFRTFLLKSSAANGWLSSVRTEPEKQRF